MTEKFKILGQYIKDMSSETPDVETFLFVKDNISKYQLGIDISSKAIKNKMIEIYTTLKFQDKENNKNISYFKKIVKPTQEELDKHKLYLKEKLKKNNFNLPSD